MSLSLHGNDFKTSQENKENVSQDPSSSVCSVCPQAAKSIFFIFSRKPISFQMTESRNEYFFKGL